jgi:tRNA-splicing ligase RtcB (3'-phosphate/5'-hydroxy nucleic acid ligase)
MNQINEKIVTFLPWEDIEAEAQQQIKNTSELPILFKHVAVMPDTHFGKGATVGTVLATKKGVVPAAVGVDIGCGMIAVRTTLSVGDLKDLKSIREGLERRIPMSAGKFNSKLTESAAKRVEELRAMPISMPPEHFDKNWEMSLGTLGGGNHFIELCLDEEDTVWLTLHSGSRGIGNKIGNHYIGIAKQLMEKFSIKLPDPDLSYLPEGTPQFDDYIKDLHWAQHFALLNREEMMDRFMTEMSYHIFGENGHQPEIEAERINCHHNFTQIEQHFGQNIWVTRKGAVQAREGMKAMIPGSMGTRSYIVSGLAHPMSFNSAPHGAGRRMSRHKAKASFTMQDLEKAMEGIEFRRSDVLVDEIPGAYKDIDVVMENAKELVKIEHTLKQVMNCKGD